ncbi:hypothetical protein VNO77_24047 [Canavalia gladiata]|uniref:Uncharacterized protein n=1 Tax=Canavalia gladiata TaxID=3824 RepID=A0AAN9L6C1_CANGL
MAREWNSVRARLLSSQGGTEEAKKRKLAGSGKHADTSASGPTRIRIPGRLGFGIALRKKSTMQSPHALHMGLSKENQGKQQDACVPKFVAIFYPFFLDIVRFLQTLFLICGKLAALSFSIDHILALPPWDLFRSSKFKLSSNDFQLYMIGDDIDVRKRDLVLVVNRFECKATALTITYDNAWKNDDKYCKFCFDLVQFQCDVDGFQFSQLYS